MNRKRFHKNAVGEKFFVSCSDLGSLVIEKEDIDGQIIMMVIPKERITDFIGGFFQSAHEQDIKKGER